MYNNTIELIKKSINVTHATGTSSVDTYDFTIQVGENEFKFEYVSADIPDVVSIHDEPISNENLTDMFFKVDNEFMALGDIMRQCTQKAYTDAEEWLACDNAEISQERRYRHDVHMMFNSGRV